MKTLESDIQNVIGSYLDRYEALKKCKGDILQIIAPIIRLKEEMFTQLKAFISSYDFQSEEEEIHFFKEIKPKLFSRLIYYQKVFQIETMRPNGSKSVQKNYLEKELDRLTDFFNQNLEFCTYYRSGNTHFDKFFFTRSADYAARYGFVPV
jgi:hypothetical protein